MSYNKNLILQRYTEACMSYRGLFGCMRYAGKTKITSSDLSNDNYILKGTIVNDL